MAQQREPGSAIALAFDQFELVDLSFRLSLTDGQCQPGAQRRFLFEQGFDEGPQHWKVARSRRCHPRIQALALARAHELTEVLDQLAHLVDLCICRAQVAQPFLFLLGALVWPKQHDASNVNG